MKQVLQSYRSGELWLAEVDPPLPAGRGARVETRASLVSTGTEKLILSLAEKSLIGKARARPDLVRRVLQKVSQEGLMRTWEQVREKLEVPVALGYSCAGVVVDAVEADALLPGARVACAGAGYASHAEINWVPRNLVVPLPDAVTFEQGSFATVGAIALQAVRQADVRLGDRVGVIGLGLIGNLVAQLVGAHGGRVVGVDLDASRTSLARELGCHATATSNAEAVDAALELSGGHGLDAVIVAASAPSDSGPLALAVEMCRLRAKVVVVGLVGMELPRDLAYRKEIDLRMSMSYGPGRYDPAYEERGADYPYAYVRYTEQRNMRVFLECIADGRVDVDRLVTHRFPIDRALDAYGVLQGDGPSLGIVLEYGPGRSDRAVPAAAPAAPSADVALAQVSRRPGVGLLGGGNHVRGVLLPALRNCDVDLVGVVTRTGPSADRVAKSAGFGWSGTDLDHLLEDPAVDLVVIGTRHHLHAEQVLAAVRAGKHVFVEKPLCLTEDELSEIASAQQAAGVYVQVGTNRRHSPYTRAMRELFGSRADPVYVSCRVNAGRLPASHWLRDPAQGGGRLLGEGIHFVDLCQAIVGAPVRRVHATALGDGPTTLPGDSWVVDLAFTDGSLGVITYAADGNRALAKERVEVFGLGRCAVVDDWSQGWAYPGSGKRKIRAGRGQDKGVVEQLRAFVEAVRTGRPAVPLDVTWHVQHVTLAAAASLGDGLPRDVSWPRPAGRSSG